MSEFGNKSHSRNPLVFGLFERIDMVEQVESGIGRIKNEMAKAGLAVPEFRTEGMFTVVLRRPKSSGKTVEETVEVILNDMITNPKITAKELQDKTGLSRRGVEYHIDKLKKEKRIQRIGSTKGGSWKVLF